MGEVLQGMEGLLLVWWKIRSGILLPVLYLVMMTVVILWGGSLQERIFQQGARKAMGWGILVWLIWLGIRLLRLILEGWVRWEWLHRLLWYGFYPCMGLLIFLAVWVSYASNRTPEDRALPPWLKGLLVLDLILAALALTNDWHQLVFRIRPSADPHWDVYTYGAGYYLTLFSYLAQLLLANGWLCWRAYKEKISLGKLWLPFGLILLYGGYIAAYILRIPWFFRSEFVLRTALFGFLWMEVLLRSRLLPGNSQYRDCFLHSRLGLTILDRQGRTVYQCRQLPTRPEGDWQRRTMPISGGQVVWYQDMGELRRKKEKLELTAQTLQRVYRLRRNSEKIQRERIHQETRKRIYEEVEGILQSKGVQFRRYTEALAQAEPGEKAQQMVTRLNVLACYLKKQCVLLLRGREDNFLPARELQLAVRELCHYLERTGLKTLVDDRLEGALPAETALAFFQLLEEASEEAVRQGEHFQICRLKGEGKGWELSLLWDPHPWVREFVLRNQEHYGGGLICRELEYGSSLVLECRRGGPSWKRGN